MSYGSSADRYFDPTNLHPINTYEPARKWLQVMQNDIDKFLNGDDDQIVEDSDASDDYDEYGSDVDGNLERDEELMVRHCIKHLRGKAYEDAKSGHADGTIYQYKGFVKWFKEEYVTDKAVLLFREAQGTYQTLLLAEYNLRFKYLRVKNMFFQNALPDCVLYEIYLSHLQNPRLAEAIRERELETGCELRKTFPLSLKIVAEWSLNVDAP